MLEKASRIFALSSRCGLSLRDRQKLKRMGRYKPGVIPLFGIEFSYVDAGTLLLGLDEIFNDECYRFHAKTDRPKIIDCGANIGLSVFYYKKTYPGAIIRAFEADPQICTVLEKNVRNAAFSDVAVSNKVVWASNDLLTFRCEGGFSGRVPVGSEGGNLATVEAIRLRDLLEEPVDMLKVDIEGAENQVIVDCADRLQNVELMFLEYHSHQDEVQYLDDILRVMRHAGMRYYVKEAHVPRHPFIGRETSDGMDLQLNIYGVRG